MSSRPLRIPGIPTGHPGMSKKGDNSLCSPFLFQNLLNDDLFREADRYLGSTIKDFLDKMDRQMGAKVVVFASWVNEKDKRFWTS
jgi:hypothetical protein